MTPSERTLKWFRDRGYVMWRVERWCPYKKVRIDMLGFIDYVALHPKQGIVGVQSTGQNFSSHRKKILEECADNAKLWLQCGGRIALVGWRRLVVERGKKRKKWEPRFEEITLETFTAPDTSVTGELTCLKDFTPITTTTDTSGV